MRQSCMYAYHSGSNNPAAGHRKYSSIMNVLELRLACKDLLGELILAAWKVRDRRMKKAI